MYPVLEYLKDLPGLACGVCVCVAGRFAYACGGQGRNPPQLARSAQPLRQCVASEADARSDSGRAGPLRVIPAPSF